MTMDLKRIFAVLCVLASVTKTTAADDKVPVPALPTPVQELADRFRVRLDASRYMVQNPRPVTYPGYEGLPLVLCTYSVSDRDKPGGVVVGKKQASVILLNASAEQIARWVVNACVEVKGSAEPKYTDALFKHIINASGGQWPVAGIVYEDILPEDGKNEIFCFRDGVTVAVEGVEHRGIVQPTEKEIKQSLYGKVVKAYSYARIQSTNRDEYHKNGGKKDVEGLAWLPVSRDLYKAAWDKDRNELMVAWARQNL
jgi:hypothetical protein